MEKQKEMDEGNDEEQAQFSNETQATRKISEKEIQDFPNSTCHDLPVKNKIQEITKSMNALIRVFPLKPYVNALRDIVNYYVRK